MVNAHSTNRKLLTAYRLFTEIKVSEWGPKPAESLLPPPMLKRNWCWEMESNGKQDGEGSFGVAVGTVPQAVALATEEILL